MSVASFVGKWAAPPDLPARVALGLAVVCGLAALFGRGRSVLGHRRAITITALVAALLSIAYIAVYLRGGPRIIDAATYFLQGRALAHGDLTWTPLEPSASFRGRFLLDHDGDLGGIFPPGYPLLLAAGFLLRAPMVVGPLLAGALVFATHRLGRVVARSVGMDPEPVARVAALFSLVCAALRYHTADTMSHGATALGIVLAFWAALVARERSRDTSDAHPFTRGRGPALGAGLAIGAVLATRPISAIAIGLVVLVLLRGHRVRVALATLPGLLFLVGAQHAVTGHWLASSQRMYYALGDGPPDCFRYGFGHGIGCVFEHGDFVHARLEDGYGLVAALGTTLRRLHAHLLDVANLEPLALLVLVPFVRLRHTLAIRAAGAVLLLHLAAYAPFYFDGDYPGGGARFLADVLPIEHVLLAIALGTLGPHRFFQAAAATLALALAGFAIHASHQHVLLRDRDGGRPMFEPDLLAQAGVTNGLVFVDTDHGFALGHDPNANVHHDVVVARLHDDDRDRLLYERLDRPATWLYKRDPPVPPSTESIARIVPWAPPDHGSAYRFEAEAEWPPLAQDGGFAVPAWAAGCASKNRVLTLTPTDVGAHATIALPVPTTGRYTVEIHVVRDVAVPFATRPPRSWPTRAAITLGGETWTWTPTAACQVLATRDMELTAPVQQMTIEAAGMPVSIDFISIRNVKR